MPKKQQNENDEREVDTVELGGVYFNIRTHEIVGFIPAGKLQTEIDVDLIALSIDPHADRYWWVTPYAYCNNNPIKIVDPDGRDIITVDEKGGITIEQCTGNDIIKSTKTHKTKELSGNGIFRAEGVQFSQKKDEHGNLKETTISGLSRSDAGETFNFMADNTDVEWGRMESKGENGSNFMVGSSHSPDFEGAVASKIDGLKDGALVRYDHSHPFGDNMKSGYLPSTRTTTANKDGGNDVDFWQKTLQNHPNASFGIRYNGKPYFYYKQGQKFGKW